MVRVDGGTTSTDSGVVMSGNDSGVVAAGDSGVKTDAGTVTMPGDSGTVTPGDAGAGVKVDAGNGLGYDAGTPIVGAITAANEVWTWVDFPDSTCANGTPTGIAVNPSTASTDVWIYMQGGGACWEGLTCFVIKSAANFETGYTMATFASDGTQDLPGFNRANTSNPFRKASFVFVPYCTGDVHSGDAVKSISNRIVYFEGARNVEAYLKRLKLTFPNATRVFLTGSSAGAFGAQLSYQRVKDAFPTAELHVLADSGQMINPSGTLLHDWIEAWNVTVPSSCTDCLNNFPAYVDWLTVNNPTSRFSLLAYSQDNVLRQFFNYAPADYQTQTESLLTSHYDVRTNAKYFYLAGTSHTMLGSQFTIASPGPAPVTLNSFITGWYNGTSGWVNVKPQ